MTVIKVYASTSVGFALASWLPTIETLLRIAGSVVALVAGILAIVVHIRSLRKNKK